MNTLTRLNGLQKDYIRNILDWVADYTEFDNFSVEGILALRLMSKGKDNEHLPRLVNQFIKKLEREKIRYQKEVENE